MEHRVLYHIAALSIFFNPFAIATQGHQRIGLNYGMQGDNLPSPSKVISLCKSRNINKLRLPILNTSVLSFLNGSDINVIISPYQWQLQQLSDLSNAAAWVKYYIVPYANNLGFQYISVGNEEIPGKYANYILPAMKSIEKALENEGIFVPITTTVSMEVLEKSNPPSQGVFSHEALTVLEPIITHLRQTGTPLLANVYPYHAYAKNPRKIGLDYALFTANHVVVRDGELGYSNMFDAMVDSIKSALERVGGEDVDVIVSETGWPSAGNKVGATVHNARIYNNNLLKHVNSGVGTPKFPGRKIEVYLYSIFNENLKPKGIARNFGMYNHDMTEVYHMNF